jgi:hypothetical protein
MKGADVRRLLFQLDPLRLRPAVCLGPYFRFAAAFRSSCTLSNR